MGKSRRCPAIPVDEPWRVDLLGGVDEYMCIHVYDVCTCCYCPSQCVTKEGTMDGPSVNTLGSELLI